MGRRLLGVDEALRRLQEVRAHNFVHDLRSCGVGAVVLAVESVFEWRRLFVVPSFFGRRAPSGRAALISAGPIGAFYYVAEQQLYICRNREGYKRTGVWEEEE